MTLIHAHLARPPSPPTRHRDLEEGIKVGVEGIGHLEHVVLTLLNKNPTQRYQTAFGLKVCLFLYVM